MKTNLIAIAIFILLFVGIASIISARGSDEMYIEVFDRDGNHISNIVAKEWQITRRVFDFDTSNFKGKCDDDVSQGVIFIFKNSQNEIQYSGFMKNITQVDGLVTFKGEDFRKIFNTQIQLDYSQEDYTNQAEDLFSLGNILNEVSSAVIAQRPADMPLSRDLVVDDRLTQFIANYSGQKITVNAWKFIKVYLGYYNYYLTMSSVDGLTVHIKYVKQIETAEIKLGDFVFDKTTSEVKTTHAIAQIKPVDNLRALKIWVYSSKELYEATPATLQFDWDQGYVVLPELWAPINFDDSFDDFELDYVIRVRLWLGEVGVGEPDREFYMQPVQQYYAIPTDGVFIEYWLGNDNEIYYHSIPDAIEIIPSITKIFESEYLSGAQYQAIWELVNSRYIEYIILTESTRIPIDIRTLTLYEMITVYDDEGSSKVIPVSEITWTHEGYSVKLGFKKTLLTELIKGGS